MTSESLGPDHDVTRGRPGRPRSGRRSGRACETPWCSIRAGRTPRPGRRTGRKRPIPRANVARAIMAFVLSQGPLQSSVDRHELPRSSRIASAGEPIAQDAERAACLPASFETSSSRSRSSWASAEPGIEADRPRGARLRPRSNSAAIDGPLGPREVERDLRGRSDGRGGLGRPGRRGSGRRGARGPRRRPCGGRRA